MTILVPPENPRRWHEAVERHGEVDRWSKTDLGGQYLAFLAMGNRHSEIIDAFNHLRREEGLPPTDMKRLAKTTLPMLIEWSGESIYWVHPDMCRLVFRSDLLRLCDALDVVGAQEKVIEAARGCPHLKEWLAVYDSFMEGSEA